MIKDGEICAFDILDAALSRVMILFVGFVFSAAYYISVKKLAHTPHKLFLCVVVTDANMNAVLVEAVLKDFGNVQA